MTLLFWLLQTSSTLPTINLDGCGVTKGCYRNPPGCSEIECDIAVTWENIGNALQFEMSADIDGWVAVGFSEDKKMVKYNLGVIRIDLLSIQLIFFCILFTLRWELLLFPPRWMKITQPVWISVRPYLKSQALPYKWKVRLPLLWSCWCNIYCFSWNHMDSPGVKWLVVNLEYSRADSG